MESFGTIVIKFLSKAKHCSMMGFSTAKYGYKKFQEVKLLFFF